MRIVPLALCYVCLCGARPAAADGAAQSGRFLEGRHAITGLGRPEIALDGGWRFQPGDDERWASPAWDDSGWQQVTATPLAEQKIPNSRFSWYRRRVDIEMTDPTEQLAVMVDATDTYAVYWNGVLLGSMGPVPPRFAWPLLSRKTFDLPLTPGGGQVSGVLAVRVWCQYPATLKADCGLLLPPILGDAALEAKRPGERQTAYLARNYPAAALTGMALLAAGVAFLLYLRARSDLLYLWFAVFLVGAAGYEGTNLVFTPANWYQSEVAVANGTLEVGFLLLLLWLLGLERYARLRRVVFLLTAFIGLNILFDGLLSLFWARAGEGMRVADAVSSVLQQVLQFTPFGLLAVAIAWKRRAANWPVIVMAGLFTLNSVLQNLARQWPDLINWHLDWTLQPYHLGPFVYQAPDVFMLLLLVTLGHSVFRHFALERRRKEQVERELQAAREVQLVLVPKEVPGVPGYVIESVYRPAAEVGGDFFQILALESGGALVVIGDVSGKGLRAAMIVSLIVGVLHTIVPYTREPGEILDGLNGSLCGRVPGGFVTCLVMRIEGDGRVTVANAGHLRPYQDGREVEAIGGSLPLGFDVATRYEQVVLDGAATAETITLITDGVLEAQNARDGLFGFDRLERLMAATPTAERIVQVACAFGQADDITVVKLTRVGRPIPPGAVSPDRTTQFQGV